MELISDSALPEVNIGCCFDQQSWELDPHGWLLCQQGTHCHHVYKVEIVTGCPEVWVFQTRGSPLLRLRVEDLRTVLVGDMEFILRKAWTLEDYNLQLQVDSERAQAVSEGQKKKLVKKEQDLLNLRPGGLFFSGSRWLATTVVVADRRNDFRVYRGNINEFGGVLGEGRLWEELAVGILRKNANMAHLYQANINKGGKGFLEGVKDQMHPAVYHMLSEAYELRRGVDYKPGFLNKPSDLYAKLISSAGETEDRKAMADTTRKALLGNPETLGWPETRQAEQLLATELRAGGEQETAPQRKKEFEPEHWATFAELRNTLPKVLIDNKGKIWSFFVRDSVSGNHFKNMKLWARALITVPLWVIAGQDRNSGHGGRRACVWQRAVPVSKQVRLLSLKFGDQVQISIETASGLVEFTGSFIRHQKVTPLDRDELRLPPGGEFFVFGLIDPAPAQVPDSFLARFQWASILLAADAKGVMITKPGRPRPGDEKSSSPLLPTPAERRRLPR